MNTPRTIRAKEISETTVRNRHRRYRESTPSDKWLSSCVGIGAEDAETPRDLSWRHGAEMRGRATFY